MIDRLFYLAHYEPGQLFGVLLIFTIVLIGALYCFGTAFSGPPPRRKTIEDMAQEAAWLRARGNLAEAEQDYKLKQAALQQTEAFIKQNIRK